MRRTGTGAVLGALMLLGIALPASARQHPYPPPAPPILLAQSATPPPPAASPPASSASESQRLDDLAQQTRQAQTSGDNAWMLTSAALVLLMTGPGLALFYGGLVRRKNVLATMMQSFAMMALITVLWAIIGYTEC